MIASALLQKQLVIDKIDPKIIKNELMILKKIESK